MDAWAAMFMATVVDVSGELCIPWAVVVTVVGGGFSVIGYQQRKLDRWAAEAKEDRDEYLMELRLRDKATARRRASTRRKGPPVPPAR